MPFIPKQYESEMLDLSDIIFVRWGRIRFHKTALSIQAIADLLKLSVVIAALFNHQVASESLGPCKFLIKTSWSVLVSDKCTEQMFQTYCDWDLQTRLVKGQQIIWCYLAVFESTAMCTVWQQEAGLFQGLALWYSSSMLLFLPLVSTEKKKKKKKKFLELLWRFWPNKRCSSFQTQGYHSFRKVGTSWPSPLGNPFKTSSWGIMWSPTRHLHQSRPCATAPPWGLDNSGPKNAIFSSYSYWMLIASSSLGCLVLANQSNLNMFWSCGEHCRSQGQANKVCFCQKVIENEAYRTLFFKCRNWTTATHL